MKNKLILLIALMFMTLGYSQTLVHGTKVQINTMDASAGVDELVARSAGNVLTDTGILVSSIVASTGLEALDEGNGIGWRFIGRNAANFGNIGLDAIDFSASTGASSIFGSTGDYSVTFGFDNANPYHSTLMMGSGNTGTVTNSNFGGNLLTGSSTEYFNNLYYVLSAQFEGEVGIAGADLNTAVVYQALIVGRQNLMPAGRNSGQIGTGLIGSGSSALIVGVANEDETVTTATQITTTVDAANPRFVVGTGVWNVATDSGTRRTGFKVMDTGIVTADEMSDAETDGAGDGAVITKSYLEGRIIRLQVDLTAGNLGTLNTVPIEILPAPGVGLVYRFKDGASGFVNHGGTDYDFAADVDVEYSTSGQNIYKILATSGLNASVDIAISVYEAIQAAAYALSVNEAVQIIATANPSVGNGTFRVVFYYTIEASGF